MNILFISSHNIIAGNLARLLQQEGHNVRLFIDDPDRNRNFDNLVPKAQNWRDELPWVGKDGLIVFDDVGYGKVQDDLRAAGYSVFGGNEAGDKLELDRDFAGKVFVEAGIATVPLFDFDGIDAAIDYIKMHPARWVVKQNGHASKGLNYVGRFADGRDAINMLEVYRARGEHGTVTLQERIDGVEIGVGRYFNGQDWIGPIELNVEHKRFFPGDLGPATTEMGTLAWYDDNEANKLFRDVLSKMRPYLRKIQFKGDFEINCIVNERGAFPLEATSRFGSPIIYNHCEMHVSPWGEFLSALAQGRPFDLEWKRGYSIVVLIATPPFPYVAKLDAVSPVGANIYFDDVLKDRMGHVHFEGVSIREPGNLSQFYVADCSGYVLYVTEMGQTVAEARTKAYDIAQHIHVPKGFYRNDIGARFMAEDAAKLQKWGYL